MILTFSVKKFENLIKTGVKKHTIRRDSKNRWRLGGKIHFWLGNPRNVKKNPYPFGIGVVSDTLQVEIYPKRDYIVIDNYGYSEPEVLNQFAINDGFENWEEMKEFFKEDFKGKVIFWRECIWN